MKDIVCFNIGGSKYSLPFSFLRQHPQTVLGQIAFEQLEDPANEVFLNRNGDYFPFVLTYLRDHGHVVLPKIFSEASFLDELAYFGIKDVDESKIVTENRVSASHSSTFIENNITSEIESWDTDRAIIALSKKIALVSIKEGKLDLFIYGPKIIPSLKRDNRRCSHLIWTELLSLLDNEERKLLPAHEHKCNRYLRTIDMNIGSVVASHKKRTIQVAMKHI